VTSRSKGSVLLMWHNLPAMLVG